MLDGFVISYKGFNKTTWSLRRGPVCVDTKADPQKRGCFCGMVSEKN